MQTRQKLQPFVDEGFVYKDRKKDIHQNKHKEVKMKQDAELHERIFAYRDKIMYCITHKKVFELENILNELTMA